MRMLVIVLILTPLVILLIFLAAPVTAAPTCGNADTLGARLAQRYGETSQSLGLTATGALMMLAANPETGTWTALIIRPDGVGCVAASGTNWQGAPAKTGDPA